MTPEEKITLYASLSPTEQAEVEAYVAANPTLRPLLDDAKRLHALAERLRARADITDEDLAETLVARRFGAQTEETQAQQTRVEAALKADPTLRATYERMQARLKALHEASESPLAQFERLTGHRLDAPALTAVPHPGPPARATDRPAARQARPLRRVAFPRWVAAAVVLVAVAGIGLFAAEPLLQPAYQQRADLESVTAALPILRAPVRGASPSDTTAATLSYEVVRDAYADALAEVDAAYAPGVLGLFDGYDSAGLDRAAVLLRDVTAQDLVAPDLALDAEFAVGAIRLYQDRRPEACAAFERVVQEQGPRSADAQALLDEFCAG
ncbi:MAG: hypothetical protein AAFP18_01470 [Bacteroidota bacterium]